MMGDPVMSVNSTPETPEIGKSIEVGDLKINYHDLGEGEVVLLIHGSGPGVTGWANWRGVIPGLANEFRVIAPDMAGFGYTSTASDVSCSTAYWAEQLLLLVDALDVPTFSIVGNSFGGSIALEFVRRYPDRCNKVVLMGAVGVSFPLTDGLDAVWGYEPSHDAMRHLLRVFVANKDMISDDLVEMRYRASVRPGVQERFSALFPAPRQRWIEALAQDPEVLRQIRHQVLLIHGYEDEVIPFAASAHLVSLLPNARLERIDRCGHWVQIEQAEQFNKILGEFLSAP